MSCRYCGSPLPDGALFCAECGRPVYADSAAATSVIPVISPPRVIDGSDDWNEELPATASTGFSIADLAFSSPTEVSEPGVVPRDLPDDAALGAIAGTDSGADARCPQCGEPIGPDDVFCGECGFVLRSVEPSSVEPLSLDSSSVESPFPASEPVIPASIVLLPGLITLGQPPAESADVTETATATETETATADDPAETSDSTETSEMEPIVFGALDALPVDPEPAAEPDDAEDAEEPDELEQSDETSVDDLVHEQPGHAPAARAGVNETDDFDEPLPFALPIATPLPATRSRPIPDPFPWGTDRQLTEDIEATRLVTDTASGTRFILQFSTGESVTVIGSGLVGRNPSMQPGEYVDQLVPIFDAGKSVSKTHLEYGQEAGRFWVSDRYSTNGTTLRQPDAEARRADPGRRYFIARGTRVDVGEQFFVVS